MMVARLEGIDTHSPECRRFFRNGRVEMMVARYRALTPPRRETHLLVDVRVEMMVAR